MKYVITGHKSGLGQALFLKLKYYKNISQNQVIGFDIVDGFDISKLATIAKIIWTCKTADVFINNAYDVFGQTKLLEYFLKSWKFNSNKLIIHIGSFLIDKPDSYFDTFNQKEIEYVAEKRKQNFIINQHRKIDSKLKIIEINPALLNTNFIHSLNGVLPNDKILQNTMHTADLVINLIDCLQFGVYTQTITFNNLNQS